MSGSHGQATRQPQLPTIQQVLHKHLAMLTVLLGWGPQAWCGFPRGTKWRKVECHRNYSLALWVDGCPGVCITATFFFSLKKQKKQKKTNSYQIHVSSPTNTEQFFFFAGNWGLINPLLLHHLFLSSSSHLSRFLPLLYENKNSLWDNWKGIYVLCLTVANGSNNNEFNG